MHIRTFAGLFTAIVIFFTTVHVSALQSSATPLASQPKSAQAAPAPTEDPKTEVFKVVTSEDNGETWKPMLQGVARKVAD